MRNAAHALGAAVVSFTANACMLEPWDGFRVECTSERILFFGLASRAGQGITLEALYTPPGHPDVQAWTRIGPAGSPFDTRSSSRPIRPFPGGPLLFPWLWEGVIEPQWTLDDGRDEYYVDVRATVGNTSTGFFTAESTALLVREPGEGWLRWHESRRDRGAGSLEVCTSGHLVKARIYANALCDEA